MDSNVSRRYKLKDSSTVTNVFKTFEENERLGIFLIRILSRMNRREDIVSQTIEGNFGEQCDFVLGKDRQLNLVWGLVFLFRNVFLFFLTR